jgi:hypothetical protein
MKTPLQLVEEFKQHAPPDIASDMAQLGFGIMHFLGGLAALGVELMKSAKDRGDKDHVEFWGRYAGLAARLAMKIAREGYDPETFKVE